MGGHNHDATSHLGHCPTIGRAHSHADGSTEAAPLRMAIVPAEVGLSVAWDRS
jgi:hypothetical protein